MNYKKAAKQFIDCMPKLRHAPTENMQRFSKGEFMTLMVLNGSSKILTGSEMAHMAKISTARMTAILNGLEKKGLICREADKEDRRRMQIELTEEGRQLIEDIYQENLLIVEDYLRFLGAEDAMQLIRILEKSKSYFYPNKKTGKESKQKNIERKMTSNGKQRRINSNRE